VFFVIDQGYLYDEEREEYEKGSGSPRFRLPILKLTAMGLRWNDGFFPCRYSSLFERLWSCAPRTPIAAPRPSVAGYLKLKNHFIKNIMNAKRYESLAAQCGLGDGRTKKERSKALLL
jgi:hypothetical protein